MNPVGYRILRFDELPSTNTAVMENEEFLNDHGLVVLAAHQTGGRGRVGKKWASLPGEQLQFTAVLHPKLSREEAAVFSLAAGVAVAEALEDGLSLHPALKWPNDLLLGGKKVCGILIETKPGAGGAPRMAVGVGLNCKGVAADFPPELAPLLTTLEEHTSRPVEMERILTDILERLEFWVTRLNEGGKQELLKTWEAKADLAGRPVRYPTPRGVREGLALSLSSEGYLLIETAEGGLHIHLSGEIEWGPWGRVPPPRR